MWNQVMNISAKRKLSEGFKTSRSWNLLADDLRQIALLFRNLTSASALVFSPGHWLAIKDRVHLGSGHKLAGG